ncbi:MAG: type I-C CRISPR-associated protein Cas8c/Csd1 [Victivallales bacterium]
MGLWQNLVNSYDKNADALKLDYPLSTTSISNAGDFIVAITINEKGDFVGIRKIEKANYKKGISNEPVTIPVTEKSMGRSSGISPHPVFEQYEYLKGSGKKFDAYIAQLKGFAESTFATEQIKAIYQYVAKKNIASDLSKMKLKDKTNIVFQVQIPEHKQAKVWKDETFFNAWHQYYLDAKRKLAGKKKQVEGELVNKKKLSKNEKKKLQEDAKIDDTISLDYITGTIQPTATFHPKKISNFSANAKLISDNDDKNFTFRGKFQNSSEAVSIGYESSQKAHQFLRYLINDRGYYCGEQVIFSFTIGSTEKLLPPPIEDKSIWDFLQEPQTKTDSDTQIALRAETGFDYADALKKSLAGFGYGKALEQHAKTAVIALDAASKGRMSVTFYREFDRSEYLKKIADWHNGCKWNLKLWDKKYQENKRYVPYIGSPSVDRMIEAVHGKPRGGKDESYTKIKKGSRERLLHCIFDGAFLPGDYVNAAVRRASNPLGITRKSKFDRDGFEQIVSTACALIRKYYQQHNKEDYKLSIELERTDRDYLYGRLLGAADKLEEYALKKKDNKRIVTAAIRYMQAFAQRPFRTWQTIHSCLNPYIQSVKGGFEFNEIQAVKNQFVTGDYEKDVPLNGSYLIGYYHEREYIDSLVAKAGKYKKQQKSNANTERDDNNDGQ